MAVAQPAGVGCVAGCSFVYPDGGRVVGAVRLAGGGCSRRLGRGVFGGRRGCLCRRGLGGLAVVGPVAWLLRVGLTDAGVVRLGVLGFVGCVAGGGPRVWDGGRGRWVVWRPVGVGVCSVVWVPGCRGVTCGWALWEFASVGAVLAAAVVVVGCPWGV